MTIVEQFGSGLLFREADLHNVMQSVEALWMQLDE
jgi:hypothetical protein